MKKKIICIILIIMFLVVFYEVFLHALPKSISRFPFFLLLFFGDVYLWYSLKSLWKNCRKLLKGVVVFFYWLPLFILIIATATSIFYPMYYWNDAVKTYLFGVVFIIYAAKFLAIVLTLVEDIFRLILFVLSFIISKAKKLKKRIRWAQLVRLYIGLAFLLILVIGMLYWKFDFKVRQETIKIPELPNTLEGLRIVQISDLHLGSWNSQSKLEEAVEIINKQQVDLVFITGDLVNYTSDEVAPYAEILKNIQSKYGVYSILGNHDYGDYLRWDSQLLKEQNLSSLINAQRSLGWNLLLNENHVFKINDCLLAIVGVENWGSHSRFPRKANIEKAMNGVQGSTFVLLLSHDPSYWENIIIKKYPSILITFSGHTHGMQFGVDLPWFKWSPAQYMYKYWAGLYEYSQGMKPQYLYVNRGLGSIGYPGRVGVRPEITVITIRK